MASAPLTPDCLDVEPASAVFTDATLDALAALLIDSLELETEKT